MREGEAKVVVRWGGGVGGAVTEMRERDRRIREEEEMARER